MEQQISLSLSLSLSLPVSLKSINNTIKKIKLIALLLIQEDGGYLEIKKLGLPLYMKMTLRYKAKRCVLVFEFFPMPLSSSINDTLYLNAAHLGTIQLPGTNELM